MHALGIFFMAGPAIGLIFLASLLLNVLLIGRVGWRIGRTLAFVWGLWMVAAAAVQLIWISDLPFSFETYVLELIIVAVGYLPATLGAWLGSLLRRAGPAAPSGPSAG